MCRPIMVGKSILTHTTCRMVKTCQIGLKKLFGDKIFALDAVASKSHSTVSHCC